MITKNNSGPKTIVILLKNSMYETKYYLDILLPYTDKLQPGYSKSKLSKSEKGAMAKPTAELLS